MTCKNECHVLNFVYPPARPLSLFSRHSHWLGAPNLHPQQLLIHPWTNCSADSHEAAAAVNAEIRSGTPEVWRSQPRVGWKRRRYAEV